MTYEVGDKVRSAKIGRREAFDGVVCKKLGQFTFHVKDEHGREWHREASELSPVKECAVTTTQR